MVISYFQDVREKSQIFLFSLKYKLYFHVVQHISREIDRSVFIISRSSKAVYGKASVWLYALCNRKCFQLQLAPHCPPNSGLYKLGVSFFLHISKSPEISG